MSNLPAASVPDAEPDRLRQAIAALESQRGLLGDAVTDMATAPLLQRLFSIEHAAPVRRAQVTVLFVDIVESTALAGRMDPEDVISIFSGFLQRAAACVQACGGRVMRFTGDGLKAAFGTQGGHEDDAAQAVQAGLDILAAGVLEAERLRVLTGLQGLALRVGVHTGEVAFGAGHEDDDTLTGDAVNVAARMEQSAPPGALRVSADTWALVRGRFIADAQPLLQLKGLERPVQTWLVHAPAAAGSGGAERGIEGLQVPMVGRDAELARLRQAIAQSAVSAPGGGLQAITVVGDAGLGKSRLLHEALEGEASGQISSQPDGRVGGQAGGFTLLHARAQPRDGLRSWGLLRQLVTGHCGIADSDSADTARSKLLAGLIPAFSAHADAETQAQLIGQLIGLDFGDAPGLRGLDARALRDRALAAWLAWLDGLARQSAGLVLVIEDLHAADEASLDALTHLMTRGRALPLTLLMSTRPELLVRRPGWGEAGAGSDTDPARITLTPLPAADSDALAAALLPGLQPVPAALRALLSDRAEGNPYYMEELVRRLLDDGVVKRDGAQWHFDPERLNQLKLPTTLVGLLQARLDALPAAEREGVQRASIVGHVFWDAALEQIDPAAVGSIPELQMRSWVKPHEPSAFAGTAEHQFDHHLLHEVTYGTVLKDDRRRGHAAVARWLAERTEGRAPEFLAITAEHAERAGDHPLAADCYERAAAQAQQRFANVLAIDCLQRSLKLVAADDVGPRLRMLRSLRGLADLTGNRELQSRTIDDSLTLLARHPDPHRLAELTMARAVLADGQGRPDDGFALASEALAQAVAIGNDDVAAWAHGYLCERLGRRGDHDGSRAHQAAGQVHAERVRDTQPIRELQLLVMAGVVALQAEQLTEAGELLNRALTRAETHHGSQFRRLQLGALNALCVHAQYLGDWAAATDLIARLADRSREMGDIRRLGVALHQSARVDLAQLEPMRALVSLAQAVASYQASGDLFHPAHAHAAAGDAHAQLGDAQAARSAYEQARALFASLAPDGPDIAEMEAMVARQDLALGDAAAARAGAQRAMAAGRPGLPLTSSEHGLASQWACVEIGTALGDPRAVDLLAQLQNTVRTVSLRRTGSPEGALQLQQRIPLFRTIMAAPAGLTTSAATS